MSYINIRVFMLSKKIFYTLILFCVLCNISYAQRTLSLEDARNLAISNNNQLKIATQEEKVAYYQKKEVFLKYFPKISATGAYMHNQKNMYLLGSSILPPSITIPFPPGSGTSIDIPQIVNDEIHKKSELDIRNVWVGSVLLTQPLFMGGRIIAYNDIMANAQELSKTKKDTRLQELIVELDEAYWQIVSLAEKKRLAESYLRLLNKLASDVTIMQEEGVATKADVLTVVVKVNEAEVTLTKVDNGLNLSRMLLNQLCGIPIEEQITLIDENSKLNITPDNQTIPSIEEALQNRSEIKSLQIANKIYKGKEKLAKAEFLPQVGLTAGYLITNPNLFNGFQNKFGGMFNIGVAVSIPLNFLTSATKVNVSKAETQIQEYQLKEAKEKIELQINQSVFKLNEAYKKYKASNKNMEKANENLRYANVGFEEGVIAASDVIAAHTAWLSANSELIDAQIDIQLCNVYLDKALGRNLNK